jgi:ubiquinone biosynthesis protein UbiJ
MLAEILENTGNMLLSADPESLQKLAELEGRVLQIDIRNIEQQLFLHPNRHGIGVSSSHDTQADVTISASMPVFLRIAAEGLDDADYKPG